MDPLHSRESPSSVFRVNIDDFYADIAAASVPAHDVLLTNPPYSADHKQKLLRYLRTPSPPPPSAQAARRAPFLLLMPAWVAASDYWAKFVRDLAADADGADDGSASGVPERAAGIFYVSPCSRYSFVHPEATGHSSAPPA